MILQYDGLRQPSPMLVLEKRVAKDHQYAQQSLGRAPLLLDIATSNAAAEAQLLTDGLAGPEQRHFAFG